ncbi:MAG: polymer-forming cytoskeletal protein [Christensenellales bacterium]
MRTGGIIKNRRGSALLMAVVTICFLLVIGLAVSAMAFGTLKLNVADSTTNNAYYAAEAGVAEAIEQIKHEVSSYYAQMIKADSGEYSSLHANFFTGINMNAQSRFAEPAFNDITTDTTFSVSGVDPDLRTFNITSTSTAADGTKYMVNGSVNVKRLDIKTGSWFIDNWAMYVGGQLYLAANRGIGVSGNIILGDFVEVNPSPWYTRLNHQNGISVIDPTAGDSLSDIVSYPSYTTPAIPSPDVYITQNNYKYTAGSTAKIYIAGAPGVNFSVSNNGIADKGSIIYSRGNLTISNCGNIYANIYCDGNLSLGGAAFYGDIYCRGNITINGGDFHSNIICDGNLNLSSFSSNGSAIVGGSINVISGSSIGNMYAAGPITLTSMNSAGVVYSSTQLNLGGFSASGIFFSAGDIAVMGSPSISGAVFAMNDIYYSTGSGTMNVTYNQTVINNLLADPDTSFFFGGGGGGSVSVNADVITGQSITPAGRQ